MVRRHVAPPSADTSLRHRNVCTDVGENPPHRIAVLVVAAEYDLVPFPLAMKLYIAPDTGPAHVTRQASMRASVPYDAPPFARWG